MIYCFDIDNTIFKTQGTDYPNSQPDYRIIFKINKLYEDGNIIKLFTARGSKSGIDWRKLTEWQLKMWGVAYHELIMGKPVADFFVDDKAMKPEEFISMFNDNL